MAVIINLHPSTFVAGGNFFQEGDSVIQNARFSTFDYNGQQAPTPALLLEIPYTDDNGEAKIEKLVYTTGGTLAEFVPSADGRTLEQAVGGKRQNLTQTSSFAHFIKSLSDHGLLPANFSQDVSILNGIQAHFKRVPHPSSKNNEAANAQSGNVTNAKPIVLVVGQSGNKQVVNQQPQQNNQQNNNTNNSNTSNSIESTAESIMLAILKEQPAGTMYEMSKMTGAAFGKFAAMPDNTKLIALLGDNNFLSNGNRPWFYSNNQFMLKP